MKSSVVFLSLFLSLTPRADADSMDCLSDPIPSTLAGEWCYNDSDCPANYVCRGGSACAGTPGQCVRRRDALGSLTLQPMTTVQGGYELADLDVASNKDRVTSFYEMAMNEHKPAEAAQRFVGPKYIQHNPSLADGKQAFVDFIMNRQKEYPGSHSRIVRAVAEGDLVVLHVHATLDNQDRGRAIVDIFRLDGGQIVEHWDAIQPVPEKAANANTMF